MAEVFYRKYRARKFSELIGQDHVVSVLRQALVNNSPAHAYLFSGPRGTGKTSTARLLAKALNCANFETNKDVCDECENCLTVNLGNSMNIIEIDAASNRGINEIRQLREAVSYSSGNGFKVYIIDEVHMLTTEAFNALLKTLEEPPSHVIFVLATTELHKVPATILSRVQHFQFRLGSQEQIKQKLDLILTTEGFNVEPQVNDLLFELAEGGYRDAESLLGKLIDSLDKSIKTITEQDTYTTLGLPAKGQISTLIDHLLNEQIGQAMNLVTELDHQGVNWQYVVKMILSTLKQSIVSGLEQGKSTQTEVDLLRTFANLYSQLKDLPSPKLAIETEILLRAKQDRAFEVVAPVAKTVEKIEAKPVVAEPKVVAEAPLPAAADNALEQEFNIEGYASLLRREHIALPAVIKAVRTKWDGTKLEIAPQTSQQAAMLERNKAALEKVLKQLMGDKAVLQIVEQQSTATKSVSKLSQITESLAKQKEETAVTQKEQETKQDSRVKDTSNAKLVEQIF